MEQDLAADLHPVNRTSVEAASDCIVSSNFVIE